MRQPLLTLCDFYVMDDFIYAYVCVYAFIMDDHYDMMYVYAYVDAYIYDD